MSLRKLGDQALLVAIVLAALYYPVRREVLDIGWVPAASFHSKQDGSELTLWDNGTYTMQPVWGKSAANVARGRFSIETFPEAPWISLIRLNGGQTLHVTYEARAYQVEDIPVLSGMTSEYVRD